MRRSPGFRVQGLGTPNPEPLNLIRPFSIAQTALVTISERDSTSQPAHGRFSMYCTLGIFLSFGRRSLTLRVPPPPPPTPPKRRFRVRA